MQRLNVFVSLLGLVWLVPAAVLADDHSLALYAFSVPTLVELGPEGELSGFVGEPVRRAVTDAGISFKLTILPIKRALAATSSDSKGCSFFFARTPDREDQFQWVGPVYQSTFGFFTKPAAWTGIAAAPHPPVIGRDAVIMLNGNKLYDDALAQGWNLIPVSEPLGGLKALEYGRARYLLASVDTVRNASLRYGKPEPVLVNVWRTTDLYMACSPDVPETVMQLLRARLDRN